MIAVSSNKDWPLVNIAKLSPDFTKSVVKCTSGCGVEYKTHCLRSIFVAMAITPMCYRKVNAMCRHMW